MKYNVSTSCIRPYRESDCPAILETYATSKLDELRFEDIKFDLLPLQDDDKRLTELMASDIYVFDDGVVVGYGALYGSEIRALFVCPKARGKGVGKRLFEFLLSKTIGSANLYVAKSNAPAKQLYANFGFKVVNEFQAKYNGVSVFANEMVRES
jgi:putative acetyltransferase